MKTLTFFSNYFNHHQRALCDRWYELLGEGFTFVETEPIEGFRAEMGWGEKESVPYVLRTYESREAYEKALRLGTESELVVMGTAPEVFIEERLSLDKLTFRYSERPLKEGFIKFFLPRLTKKYLHLHVRNRKKRIYILAASAYTAWDYKRMFDSYPEKIYRFGYFPKHLTYEPKQLLKRKEAAAARDYGDAKIPTILWEGRMLKLKRPDQLIEAARLLKEQGYNFRLRMIGEGELRPRVEELCIQYGLTEIVDFSDFLSPKEAREKMADAKIYVMTSNFLEGWGSVIYEALNAGCACVVSHAPGAAPWLVKHNETGLLYQSDKPGAAALAGELSRLLSEPELVRRLSENAYRQMASLWNERVAAERVIGLYEALSAGKDTPYQDGGPCSKAEILKNNWYRE
ncbi:MAG: glycosyltransferase family 4 protein [Lachnospiraceae bacterium]|nr:glycosyltransferase family 4 protein [Lachnospiraceae bacterium]